MTTRADFRESMRETLDQHFEDGDLVNEVIHHAITLVRQRLASAPRPIVPPLPSECRYEPDLGEAACPWLDRYIAHSRETSPRSFDGYHQACGLWLMSVVAARRVYLPLAAGIWTPLFVALLGRSSIHYKTSAAKVAIGVLKQAGLRYLLAPSISTPQAFLRDLSGRLPVDFKTMTNAQQQTELRRLAFPAQRGWYYSEFGQMLSSINKRDGHMAEFKGLLRVLDDNEAEYSYSSIRHGKMFIDNPYLALLLTMTPADMRPFSQAGAAGWGDGFFARFLFITPPDTAPLKLDRWKKDLDSSVPAELTKPLVEWHQQLGVPYAELVPDEESKEPRLIVHPASHSIGRCTLGDGVYDAFYAYGDALLEMVHAGQIAEDLAPNYVRLAEKALRTAMLFASMTNHGRIEMKHWARAQGIAEEWREGLHYIYQQANESGISEKKALEDKIVEAIENHGELSPSQLQRASGTGLRSFAVDELRKCCDGLVEAGVLTRTESANNRGYKYAFPQTVAEN